MKTLALHTLAAAAVAFAGSAQAQLVINGGFETGDFSGWTESGVIGTMYGVDTAGPHQGNYSAFFGASTPAAWISQAVATTAGQAYRISFWFDRSPQTTSGLFSVTFGGAQVFNDPGTTFAFGLVTVNVVANSSSSELRFAANNNSDFYTLDSVSVTAVPEPAPAALLAAGLAAMALWRRRKA